MDETKIFPFDQDGIVRAAQLLREGAVVALPTETVYGLAADATKPEAVTRIFTAKARPHFNPLIVHVPQSLGTLTTLAAAGIVDDGALQPEERKVVEALLENFWPGPLTVVLPRGERIPKLVTGGLDSVAVRQPRHPAFLAVLTAFDGVLAAPSANRFCSLSPTTAQHVEAELGGLIPAILDGGPCESGIESTIVKVMKDGAVKLLRRGATALEEIEAILGKSIDTEVSATSVEAPGMLARHYAPKKTMWLCDERNLTHCLTELLAREDGSIDIVLTDKDPRPLSMRDERLVWHRLSPTAEPREAAKNLFATLRTLDQSESMAIVALLADDSESLYSAINDRLRRGGRIFAGGSS